MTDTTPTPDQDPGPAEDPTLALPASDVTPTTALPDSDARPTAALPRPDARPSTSLGDPPSDTPRADGARSDAGAAQPGLSTATLPNPRIAAYLAAARTVLADLPSGERAELIDDLDAHLHEILAEEGEAFETRLGAPSEYAAEFRASAGYPPAEPQRRGAVRRTRSRLTERGRALRATSVERVRTTPGGPGLLAFLPRLRPAWWVMRAWLVAAIFGVAWPTGQYSGTGWWGALAWQLLLVVGSVAWGLRAERHRHRIGRLERVALGAVNAFAVGCCLLALVGAGPLVRTIETQYVEIGGGEPVPGERPGVWLDEAPVTNFVAYDLAGQPIEGFQLFDQNGNPVIIDETYAPGPEDAWVYPVPVTTSNGTPVGNVFPIRRVVAGEADPYYCMAVPVDDQCDPFAVATVQAEQPAPVGSPWKDLTVTPVPGVGATLPLDMDGNPIWSTATPTAQAGPSGSPSPAAPTPTPEASASPADSPSATPTPSGERPSDDD